MKRAHLKRHRLFYQFCQAHSAIKVFFSNRKRDVSFHHQPALQVSRNRTAVLKEAKIPLAWLTCGQQVHGDCIRMVAKKEKGRGSADYQGAFRATDALVTNEKNIALAVFTADCLPIIAIDKKKNVIAAMHAGWKSTHQQISRKTVQLMQEKFQSNPKDILVFFGPALRKCCYEVGREFLDYFPKTTARHKGKLFFNIIKENYQQLRQEGVLAKNIFDSGFCTSCRNDEFFSFRREKDACGRQMAVVIRRS